MVAQGAAKIEDVALDYFRLNEGVRPQGLKQFVLGDQVAGVLDQKLEHGKRFGCQSNPLVVAIGTMTPETFVDYVQPKRREFLHDFRVLLFASKFFAHVSYRKTGWKSFRFKFRLGHCFLLRG